MTPRTYLPLALTALVAAATAGSAGAQLIAYDPFNNFAPSQLNGTVSSGVPWPASGEDRTWSGAAGIVGGVVQPGSLTYGPLQTGGNHAQMSWSSGGNFSFRSLGSNRGGATADFWISFLADLTQPGQDLVLYHMTNQTLVPQMSIGAPLSGGVGLALGAGVTGSGGQTLTVSPALSPNGATHFYAAHFQLGSAGNTNTIALIIDPDFSSLGTGMAPTGGSTVTFTTATDFALDYFLIGNFGGVSGAAGAFDLDEIRLGTTWASVSPVPEPSTLLLAGGGLAVAVCVRRRSKVRTGR
ncbi:MAG TPA: PEP-CTERM sorting domain-containing protein [Gemmataceae bacterium]|jgi:hypothetical protein